MQVAPPPKARDREAWRIEQQQLEAEEYEAQVSEPETSLSLSLGGLNGFTVFSCLNSMANRGGNCHMQLSVLWP